MIIQVGKDCRSPSPTLSRVRSATEISTFTDAYVF